MLVVGILRGRIWSTVLKLSESINHRLQGQRKREYWDVAALSTGCGSISIGTNRATFFVPLFNFNLPA